MTRVAVFLGGSGAVSQVYVEATQDLGRLLVARGLGLVYGGGRIGLMGVLADAVIDAGGEVIGVMPQHLVDREIAHLGLTQLRVVADMSERKLVMAQLADCFVALPGGYGTLDELFEMLTWTQIGIQDKPCAVLNVAGYFDHLLEWIDHAVTEGLVRAGHQQLLIHSSEPHVLLDQLEAWVLPQMPTLS